MDDAAPTGFYRLPQIIGDKSRNIEPLIPVSRGSWYSGVRQNIYPQPVKLGTGMVGWRKRDIHDLIDKINHGELLN